MKFTIGKPDFIKVLQRMQGIVEKRNTMPILANVLLDASKGKITIMATDLEVFIKDSVQAGVSEEGSITVNARKVFEIVKELPGETVDVTAGKDDKLTLKAGKARFNVMGLPAKDFPVFPVVDEGSLQAIDGEALREMIDKTSFAVSTDETRYNINGFLLEREEGKIKMVATDGHRLALIIREGDNIAKGQKEGVLLPRKGVMEMKKVLDEKEGSFFLGITQKNAVMKRDSTVVTVRLLEGEFPDYRRVIPKDNDKEAKAMRGDLLASLKRVSILSTDKIKGVKFSFNKDKLVLSSSSPDIGEATEDVDIDFPESDIEIAFNARYFIDVLEAISNEKVSIVLKDSLSPGIIRPEGGEDYTYIIMPMRL
ncbi:MAG: DNA polymerase III subunit beta [Deltaproteobacteria bacterium GWC2_55_46]|nr:MAG: DNA polymerase III subunit beta [Deltaproteobacteria bacterium GWA2_55_82]OGQ62067.1 MAG: DNA polymerase III subunit beta [Deltaproteobacteria bacterium RIFCSPLOWO2_02_FULL_55_12]OIJ74075.1 MAG: DNA polymerase III subunit beta [Deltaproteobacteria bacterium GWC2_55_46]